MAKSSLLQRKTLRHNNKYEKDIVLNDANTDSHNRTVEIARLNKQIQKLQPKVAADPSLKHRWNKLHHALAKLEQVNHN